MKTDFALGKTRRHKSVVISRYPDSTYAWWATMEEINKLNAQKGKEDCHYWLRYE